MAGDLDELPFGERLKTIRRRKGKTRRVIAERCGRSEQWLKKIECGSAQMPRLPLLLLLADALELHNLTELVGEQQVPLALERRTMHDELPRVQAAILSWDFDRRDRPAIDPFELRRRVRDAWHIWHSSASPRSDTAVLLPALLVDGQHAERSLEGDDRREASRALAETYVLAEHWLAWIARSDMLMLVGDRAVRTAQDADDPLVLGEAAWALGNVARYVDSEMSVELIEDAAAVLRERVDSETGTDEERAIWGTLNLHNAITTARDGREGDSLRYLDRADATAKRLPKDFVHPLTVFSPWNVDLHAVSVRADLSKNRDALREARKVDPSAVTSVERRSRLWLDMARSYHQDADQHGALSTLRRACETSLEGMRYSPVARSIAGDLVDKGGPLVSGEARLLARDIGVVV